MWQRSCGTAWVLCWTGPTSWPVATDLSDRMGTSYSNDFATPARWLICVSGTFRKQKRATSLAQTGREILWKVKTFSGLSRKFEDDFRLLLSLMVFDLHSFQSYRSFQALCVVRVTAFVITGVGGSKLYQIQS